MIKRVIAQNGSPTADWAAITEPMFMINTSQILGDELGCDNRDFSRLVDCVGKRSNNEIKILKMRIYTAVAHRSGNAISQQYGSHCK
ncbi:neuroligin-4, Y-linked [Nephila pilipes]|uniref:Neuroligin-4, Y-linked n=1 Tax=Nephila pilipes TaxID=299642 RepID=A0A8X6NGP7_NEPPI|nr:neuroligin-4, Y-linked [Nephila pilipes]GFT19427.1 neuroligin-4, Y-linked [Nephila pilipes]